jgi:hypothetical protein
VQLSHVIEGNLSAKPIAHEHTCPVLVRRLNGTFERIIHTPQLAEEAVEALKELGPCGPLKGSPRLESAFPSLKDARPAPLHFCEDFCCHGWK